MTPYKPLAQFLVASEYMKLVVFYYSGSNIIDNDIDKIALSMW